MAQRDGMNLLPENERQAAEAALRKASQPGKPGEVRLVMPQSTAKAEPEKKSWWAKRKEARAKKIAEAKADEEARAKVIAQAPKVLPTPAPTPAPVAKQMTPIAPAPVPVPAPKPSPIAKKAPAKKAVMDVAKPAPIKAAAAPATPVAPTPKAKAKAGSMHEPESANGFLSPKVNLVPQGVAEQAQGVSWGLYAGILVVVLGVWVSLSGYAIYRASAAQARVQEAQARLDQVAVLVREYEKDKNVYIALQKQFLLVKDVVEGHVYWTPFLQKLEENTIPDVYYLGMSANRSGQVTLRAVAKSYSAAARQIRAFERSSGFVKTVQVNQVRQELQKGATLPVPVIAFDVQLKLVDDIFTILAPENGAQPIQP